MRSVICLLLVLVMCMNLCGAVFATADSVGQDGTAPTIPDGDGIPDTGDDARLGMWMLVMVLALLVLVAVIVCYRKYMKR